KRSSIKMAIIRNNVTTIIRNVIKSHLDATRNHVGASSWAFVNPRFSPLAGNATSRMNMKVRMYANGNPVNIFTSAWLKYGGVKYVFSSCRGTRKWVKKTKPKTTQSATKTYVHTTNNDCINSNGIIC